MRYGNEIYETSQNNGYLEEAKPPSKKLKLSQLLSEHDTSKHEQRLVSLQPVGDEHSNLTLPDKSQSTKMLGVVGDEQFERRVLELEKNLAYGENMMVRAHSFPPQKPS
mmetsp:Transcript_3450/g.4572  ORF Transcript_3450/g.4572 Transcript_3450/m.4572 type:complete len:109 (+) Transcript_3450:761-1087(+)